jgi:hypothetical protein
MGRKTDVNTTLPQSWIIQQIYSQKCSKLHELLSILLWFSSLPEENMEPVLKIQSLVLPLKERSKTCHFLQNSPDQAATPWKSVSGRCTLIWHPGSAMGQGFLMRRTTQPSRPSDIAIESEPLNSDIHANRF